MYSNVLGGWDVLVQTQLKLKICIGMSAKLIANAHVQIYKYTEYDQ